VSATDTGESAANIGVSAPDTGGFVMDSGVSVADTGESAAESGVLATDTGVFVVDARESVTDIGGFVTNTGVSVVKPSHFPCKMPENGGFLAI
jgi:predicted sugar kinase